MEWRNSFDPLDAVVLEAFRAHNEAIQCAYSGFSKSVRSGIKRIRVMLVEDLTNPLFSTF